MRFCSFFCESEAHIYALGSQPRHEETTPKGGILNLLRIRSGTCVKRCNGAGFREFHEHGTGLKFRHIGYG